MTVTLNAADASATTLGGRRFPVAAMAATAAAALVVTAVVFRLTPLGGRVGFVMVGAVAVLAALGAVSWRIEGRRKAVNRMVTIGAYGSMVIALIPLAAVLGYTVKRGLDRLSLAFLTHSMANIGPLDAGGGVYHAIIGTLEQVALASLVAVPLGLLVAIYITEYGRGQLANAIRFFIDVMTGIPSIVAGLFVFAFWVLGLHRGFSGLAAALSLAVLMLPVVVRSSEEMIRLVPSELREASYALGVPKWRTILSVVLPTAATGITTGVMLAIARVTGETAPLLLTAGGNNFIHVNPFSGIQSALPLFVFDQTGRGVDAAVNRAWAAALTLILIVVALYIAARLLTRRNTLARR
jgi:phosphate transport system permease protein